MKSISDLIKELKKGNYLEKQRKNLEKQRKNENKRTRERSN